MAKRNNQKSSSSGRAASRNGRGSSRKDAISLLKGDHKIVQDLLQKLVGTSSRPSKSRETILSKVEQEIKTHSRIEEEIFYPAFKESVRKKDEQKLFFEAKEEHHLVDVVLNEFQEAQDNDAFAAKCKVLKELFTHHQKEEEREMFPMAKKSMGQKMLQELGERIEERKQEIMSEMIP
jgi:hemerythrin superfamily protein